MTKFNVKFELNRDDDLRDDDETFLIQHILRVKLYLGWMT